MSEPYRRILLKLSGEALCAKGSTGLDPSAVDAIASQIAEIARQGTSIGIVIGAGNFIRGRALTQARHIHPTTADYMGMLGTVMNALALRDALAAQHAPAVAASAIRMDLVCETYYRPRVMQHLAEGRIVVFAGGTSHPGVTTDMCAAIRAAEIEADALLKATKVDGVFDSDPAQNPEAKQYDRLTHAQALAEKLGVMDLPAMAFCLERNLPIVVFNMNKIGQLPQAVAGENVGTLVTS